jgi:hypothetical protein
MNCTPLHIEKQIVCRSLCVLVLMGLLIYTCTAGPDHLVWDEELVLWARRCRTRRGSRAVLAGRVQVVRRRAVVMLSRMGLLTVLLVWSGWGQHWPTSWLLLSLPLTDALLSILPLYRPQVLKVRAYPHLVREIHRLYGVILCILLFTCLSVQRKGNTIWAVGGCVQVADGAWASGEIEEDGTWRLEMQGHFILRWKPRNEYEKRVLLVLFRQVHTAESTSKWPFLRQEWLAEWFKTYQEWISRWQRYVRQGGLEKLKKVSEN